MCVFVYVYVAGWFGRFVLQGGAVSIGDPGEGTFTNCNFTSNEANVSLEEELVDSSEMEGVHYSAFVLIRAICVLIHASSIG